MTNNPLPSPDSQRTPSKGLAEVLVEARADILKRMEKYILDVIPSIHTLKIGEFISSIFLQYPEIFIRDYASLDAAKQFSLKKEIASLIESARFKIIETEAYQSREESPKLKVHSLVHSLHFDIEETINVDGEALYKLFNAVYDTTVTKLVFTKLAIERLEESWREFNDLYKSVSNKVEFGPMDKEVEKASLNALKKIRDRVKEFKSSKDISNDKKIEDLNKIASHDVEVLDANQRGIELEEFIQQKAQTLQKKGVIFSLQPKQEKALQPPDLSEIPLWRNRKLDGMPLDFIKTHYGQYLSAFGAEQNTVFQDQIRAHDPKLIQGVKNQLREEGKRRKVSDFVKTRSARVDQELENVSVEDLKEKPRLASTLYSRETRAAKAKAAAPSRSVTRK